MSPTRITEVSLVAAVAMGIQSVSPAQTTSPPFRVTSIDLSTSASVQMTTTCREYAWDVEYASGTGQADLPGTWGVTRECPSPFACLDANMNLAWSSGGMEVTFSGSIAGQPGGEASAAITLRLRIDDTTIVAWPGGQVILDASMPDGACSPTFEDPEWPLECQVIIETPLQSDQSLAISIVGSAEIAGFRLVADSLLRFESPPASPQRHEESLAEGLADGERSIESAASGCYGGSAATSSFELLGDRLTFSVHASGTCGPVIDVPWWIMACSNANVEFLVRLTRPHVVIAEGCMIWCNFSSYCWLGGPGSKGTVSATLPPGQYSYLISGDAYSSIMSPGCHGGSGSARFIRLNAADVWYDGIVGAEDLAMVLGHWGEGVNPARVEADVNMDGAVNALDIAMVIGAWGTNGCRPIPEAGISCP